MILCVFMTHAIVEKHSASRSQKAKKGDIQLHRNWSNVKISLAKEINVLHSASATNMSGWIILMLEFGIVECSSLRLKSDPDNGGKTPDADKRQRRGGAEIDLHILDEAMVKNYINAIFPVRKTHTC